jgi:ElaB/YqjD/DUF883 family membrane-anchored ribosome-binding protein
MTVAQFIDRLRQEAIERDADCVMRDIQTLLERMAFKEVALIIREANDLLREAQECAEDEAESLRASVHRQSA